MINLKFYNYDEELIKAPDFNGSRPFIEISPNIFEIKKQFEPYKNFKNYILIGNGGSNTSFDSFWTALGKDQIKKSVSIVTTMDPDYLKVVRNNNSIKDTLVIMISKSGDTVGALESLLYFNDYEKLIITSKSGALNELANRNNWKTIEHPSIGGRFSGRSVVGYGPSYLLDLDIDSIENGAKKAILEFQKDNNTALELAKFLFNQELAGKADVFMPVYSQFLEGFNHLITQLMHESVCKSGKGQTIFATTAPESQHHSNQRFFGGPKNMAGVFITVKNSNNKINISVSGNCKDILLRDGKLEILDGIDLNQSLQYEALGTIEDASSQKIPLAHVEIEKISPESMGEYLVFWQFVAYYSAVIRGQNPFDQSQVEKSKIISFELRKTNNN